MSSNAILSRILLFTSFLTMVLVAGLRSVEVGTDSQIYLSYFVRMDSFDVVLSATEKTWEIGYWALNWLVLSVSQEYMALFVVIAVIVVGCYQYAILKYSSHIGISFFIFITMGFYTFFFNGARQGLACGICALAIGPLVDKNLKKYICYILVAILFHKTAIVMVPVYFLVSKSNSLKINFLYGSIGVVTALLMQEIVAFGSQYDERYLSYATAGEGGGYLTVAFTCFLTVFFLAFKRLVRYERERYDLFLNMFVFGTIISLVSVVLRINPSGIVRLSFYFNISVIFLFPIVYKNIEDISAKLFFSFSLVSGLLFYFLLALERFGNLTPYTFNPLISLY
jgi:hypothetical protein